jgi:sugar phosphate isomerase/epimerase
MSVQRFFGSAWATVHRPADPRRLWIWVLEAKFAGLMVSPGPRGIDWAGLRQSMHDLPVRVAAVRVGSAMAETSATAGLASAREPELATALAAIDAAVGIAMTLGCRTVLLEPGLVPVAGEIGAEDLADAAAALTAEKAAPLLARRKTALNAALDRVCRALFGVVRRYPDLQFALLASRSLRAVADRPALEAIFEDLSQLRLGYWHDAGVVGRRAEVLAETQGEWLEAFSHRCLGFMLADSSAEGIGLPPGAGSVDYAMIGSYLRRTGKPLAGVVDLDPGVAPTEIPGLHSYLDKFGL